MRQALTLTAAALLLAACGGNKGDQRVEGGGLGAPEVGAGGGVNGNGMTDSNAAVSAESSGTGAPSSAGISTAGTSTSVGGKAAADSAGRAIRSDTATTGGRAGAAAGSTGRP